MNREERRTLQKEGLSKETIEKMEALKKPCSIGEVVHISRAAAEDVCGSILDAYSRDSSSILMAMTLQIELLKSKMIESGLLSEEEFTERYKKMALEFEEQQREFLKSMQEESKTPLASVSTGMATSDIDIQKV